MGVGETEGSFEEKWIPTDNWCSSSMCLVTIRSSSGSGSRGTAFNLEN